MLVLRTCCSEQIYPTAATTQPTIPPSLPPLAILLTPITKFHSGHSHIPCLCLQHALSLLLSDILAPLPALPLSEERKCFWPRHTHPWVSEHACLVTSSCLSHCTKRFPTIVATSSNLRVQPLVGQGRSLFNKLCGASSPRQGRLEREVPVCQGLGEARRGMQETLRSKVVRKAKSIGRNRVVQQALKGV